MNSTVLAKGSTSRRRFLTYLVSAPILTVAVRFGAEEARAEDALIELPDIGDLFILAGALTEFNLVLQVTADNHIRMELPRAESGQGITTAIAMMVAEELDARLSDVNVELSDARPELLFNQLTGSSNTVRMLWQPLRALAALARARLVTAAAQQWQVSAGTLTTRDTMVFAPDGRSASYGSLSAAAARILVPIVSTQPKDPSRYTVVGKPVTRIDAREIVTGKAKYATDLQVPGAKPTVVARPPTLKGQVASFDAGSVSNLPGVLGVVQIPTGVAIIAETFDQALKAKEKLVVYWQPGPVSGLSDAVIRSKLRNELPPLVPPVPLLERTLDADFEFAFVSHAPMEVLAAVADVRNDRAEIWYAGQSPILAQEAIAVAVGLPLSKVDVHVIRGGGSFGRRLFFDAAVEAAQISRAAGRPIKLMWTRNDDTRHGRMRPASQHKVRICYASQTITRYEHRMAAVRTDLSHGLGEALTAVGFIAVSSLGGQAFFGLSQRTPYNLGLVINTLNEVKLDFPTGSWRSVFSGTAAVVQEIMVDAIAKVQGRDPVSFRRDRLTSSSARAVLDKVASAGQWGRTLPPGYAQGVAVWEEYKSSVAYLVEIDARDPQKPRIVKAVVAADVGRVINPKGLEAQLMGALIDGISVTLYAGLHIDNGAVREGSFGDFHYARMRHAPPVFEVYILPTSGDPGGAGELGVPAAAAAVANAYARATGIAPRTFPIPGIQW